jgi:hypothetical protein
VRPDEGLTVAAVAYDSRQDLAAAREGGREFREDFAPSMGIEVVAHAEFDLVVADLGAPETV